MHSVNRSLFPYSASLSWSSGQYKAASMTDWNDSMSIGGKLRNSKAKKY